MKHRILKLKADRSSARAAVHDAATDELLGYIAGINVHDCLNDLMREHDANTSAVSAAMREAVSAGDFKAGFSVRISDLSDMHDFITKDVFPKFDCFFSESWK